MISSWKRAYENEHKIRLAQDEELTRLRINWDVLVRTNEAQAEELERAEQNCTRLIGEAGTLREQLTKQAAVIEEAREELARYGADPRHVQHALDALTTTEGERKLSPPLIAEGAKRELEQLTTTETKHEMYVGGTWVTVAEVPGAIDRETGKRLSTEGEQEPHVKEEA